MRKLFFILIGLAFISTPLFAYDTRDELKKPYTMNDATYDASGYEALSKSLVSSSCKIRGWTFNALANGAYLELWDNNSTSTGTCIADIAEATSGNGNTVVFPNNTYLYAQSGLTIVPYNCLAKLWIED